MVDKTTQVAVCYEIQRSVEMQHLRAHYVFVATGKLESDGGKISRYWSHLPTLPTFDPVELLERS